MGYRADGKRLKNTDPMYTIVPYIMTKRYDAMNMININVPLEPINAYLAKAREQGKKYSHMDVILAAYTRMVGQFPELNRFIVNKKIYARNELAVAMVVLKSGPNGGETISKMKFDYDYTIDDVHKEVENYVAENRKGEGENATDKMIKFLVSVPGFMFTIVGFCKFLDKHGLLPKKLIDLSPFHASCVITNLASIRTNYIYHHIYEFGTTSMSIAMGNSVEVPKSSGGEIVHEKCIPLGIVMDERICTGAYSASAFRCFKKCISNPELLELPPEKEPVWEIPFKNKKKK